MLKIILLTFRENAMDRDQTYETYRSFKKLEYVGIELIRNQCYRCIQENENQFEYFLNCLETVFFIRSIFIIDCNLFFKC